MEYFDDSQLVLDVGLPIEREEADGGSGQFLSFINISLPVMMDC